MNAHQEAWLKAHSWRSRQWLADKLADGFHIHHVDGNHSNNEPANLILIEATDHFALHSGRLSAGILAWRKRPRAVRHKPVVTDEMVAAIDAVFSETGDTLSAVRHISDRFDLSWASAKRTVKDHLRREN
jgi:hypothetical protein